VIRWQGQDEGLGEKKKMGLQNGGAVFVWRATVMVVSRASIIRFGAGGGVGVLARGVAIMPSDGFPMLKEVRERSEAQQEDSQPNEEHEI
jgi:hypothetical protein